MLDYLEKTSGVECPYCHLISEDTEFCDFCGKGISNVLDSEKKSEEDEKINDKWYIGSMECDAVNFNGYLKDDDYVIAPQFIENPAKCEEMETGCRILFFKKEGLNLDAWINKQETLDLDQVFSIIKRVCEIIIKINEEGYILGSFDISDFWIENDDISNILLRQTRPFIKLEAGYEINNLGHIVSPEIQNDDVQNINSSSDVFLVGRLFMHLIFSHRNITEYSEYRYLSYHINATHPNMPIELRYWIGKSTSMFVEERYECVEQQYKVFNYILKRQNERDEEPDKEYIISHCERTDLGNGKRLSKDNDLTSEVINEDNYLFIGGTSEYENKALAIVADGISTCKYGSGYEASKCVIDTAEALWKEQHNNINNKDDVEAFFKNLVSDVNSKILQSALNYIPLEEEGVPKEHISSAEIMGSTLAAVVFIDNKVYTVSIGDSRIYLWSRLGKLSLLTTDDNYGNDSIKNNISWNSFKLLEDKSNLTNFIGGADTTHWPFEARKAEFIVNELRVLEDETLLLCSDGVVDYLSSIGHRSDEWNCDIKINEMLKEAEVNNHSLEETAERFITEANNNGGGDNITLILIKVSS